MLEEKSRDDKSSNISSKIINITIKTYHNKTHLRMHKNNVMPFMKIKQNCWRKCWKKRYIIKLKPSYHYSYHSISMSDKVKIKAKTIERDNYESFCINKWTVNIFKVMKIVASEYIAEKTLKIRRSLNLNKIKQKREALQSLFVFLMVFFKKTKSKYLKLIWLLYSLIKHFRITWLQSKQVLSK